MSKKSFKTPFDKLLGDDEIRAPRTNKTKEVRSTFIINAEHLEKLKAISFWEKKLIKKVLDEALTEYFNQYETKNGLIKLPK